MALETINVGNYVNDGTGDDLRTAFTKINANFEELDLLQGQNNTISNVGTGIGLYKEKIGVDLKLRTIVSSNGISVSLNNPNEVIITNNRISFNTIQADSGSIAGVDNLTTFSIVGGTGVTTSLTGNVLTIEGNDYDLALDSSPTLGGDLNLNSFDITGTGNIDINGDITANNLNGDLAGNVTGNLTGLVYGIDVREVNSAINMFDFGPIDQQATNPIQWITMSLIIDMGSFTSPAAVGIDGGTII